MGKYLKYLLPLLFAFYVANITLFVHAHVINGTTVVHSHPYKVQDHAHSEAEYVFCDMFSHFSATDTSVEVFDDVPEPVYAVCELICCTDESLVADELFLAGGTRGPPFLVF